MWAYGTKVRNKEVDHILEAVLDVTGLARIFCVIHINKYTILCVYFTQGRLILYLIFFMFDMVSELGLNPCFPCDPLFTSDFILCCRCLERE